MIDVEILSTVTTCDTVMQAYYRASGTAELSASYLLRPIDVFVLDFLLSTERNLDVVDLAADVTGGGTAAFLARHESVRRVAVGGPHQRLADSSWRDRFGTAVLMVEGDLRKVSSFEEAGTIDFDDEATVVLAVLGGAEPEGTERYVAELLQTWPAHMYFFFGLGRIGESPALEGLLAATRSDVELRAIREISPFLADSDVGLAWGSPLTRPADSIARLERLFSGNLGFIELLSGAIGRTLANGGSEAPAVDEKYHQLPLHLRSLAEALLPADATCIVMTRGDDSLLELGDRRGRHFPETPEGEWAGHYPKDAAEAISQLEDQRSRGANFLVVPYTAFWWLGYYVAFAVHLDQHYQRTWSDEWSIIYDLSGDR